MIDAIFIHETPESRKRIKDDLLPQIERINPVFGKRMTKPISVSNENMLSVLMTLSVFNFLMEKQKEIQKSRQEQSEQGQGAGDEQRKRLREAQKKRRKREASKAKAKTQKQRQDWIAIQKLLGERLIRERGEWDEMDAFE